MKTLFMESTEISPERTIVEIETILIQYGANVVLKEYNAGAVEAVSFKIRINEIDIPFRLPCRWTAIAQVLRKRANISDYYWETTYGNHKQRRKTIEEKARRVAWRQILRWVQAQMALVETSMVKVEEVFFQYVITASGRTLYELHSQSMGQIAAKSEA